VMMLLLLLLLLLLLNHFHPLETIVCAVVSTFCEDDGPMTMRIQQDAKGLDPSITFVVAAVAAARRMLTTVVEALVERRHAVVRR